MYLLAFALRHLHAPLAIREKFSIQPANIENAYLSLNSIQNIYHNSEFSYNNSFIISTCNRSEIYIYLNDTNPEYVIDWWANFCQQSKNELIKHIDIFIQEDAISHLFEVSCGADSMVLGETQIYKQIKDAYANVQRLFKLNPYLHSIIQRAFNCSKDVRTKTNIGKYSVSFATAGIKLTQHIFTNMHEQNMLFIGAGDMMQTLVAHFSLQNPKKITIANRNLDNAKNLVKTRLATYKNLIDIQPLHKINELLADADIIVTCINYNNEYLINANDIKNALQKRRFKPMYILDLSVPLVVDIYIKKISDIFFYTVDDLSYIIEEGQSKRHDAKQEVKNIIYYHILEYHAWEKTYKIKPLIKKLQNKLLKQVEQSLQEGVQHNSMDVALHKFMNYSLHNILQILPHLTVEQQKSFEQYLDK